MVNGPTDEPAGTPTDHARPQTSPDFPPCSDISLTPAARRKALLQDVDVLIDVGANEGQYASWVRGLGYRGRIVSFEPQRAAFARLANHSAGDPLWESQRLALGPVDGEVRLRIARDSTMTSAFPLSPELARTFPEDSTQVGTEDAPMRSLDSLWPSLGCEGTVYLKADVEGYELSVLEGAHATLASISLLELELALTPTFQGAPLIDDVLAFLAPLRFSLVAIEANHADNLDTAEMYQVDAILRQRLR